MWKTVDQQNGDLRVQKWEVHVREAKEAAEERGKKGRPGRLQRAADALQAWARIPRPCRDALKHADPFRVDELEMRIMDFLETEVHHLLFSPALPVDSDCWRIAYACRAHKHGLSQLQSSEQPISLFSTRDVCQSMLLYVMRTSLQLHPRPRIHAFCEAKVRRLKLKPKDETPGQAGNSAQPFVVWLALIWTGHETLLLDHTHA